jgi:hypothetical protein
MSIEDDKHFIKRQLEKSFEQLRQEIEERIAKLEATILKEFRRDDSPAGLREQSRAAIQHVNEIELKTFSDQPKKLEGH